MEKTCIVDFDETLLTIDSLRYILKKEKFFLYPPILFWGGLFFLFKNFLAKKNQIAIRKRVKFFIIKKIHLIGEEKILSKYSSILSQYLNINLIDFLINNYKKRYIISSSWQSLIENVLKEKGIKGFIVFGVFYSEKFVDFKNYYWNIGKVSVIMENNIGEFDLFTDSYDDRPLMEKSKNAFLIPRS
jgi:hypothetical protein